MTPAARTGPAIRHLHLVPDVPRPLPRQVKPLRDEVMSSYISRLAAANHLPFSVVLNLLWQHLPGTADDPLARVRWFAAITALNPAALLMALPELRTGRPGPGRPLPTAGRPVPHLARRAPPCRYCAAAHGASLDPDTSAQIWASAENNVCRTHQIWTGPGASAYDRQPSLRSCPDITAAQTRHDRLVRRHGRREAFKAFLDAREIWTTLEWLHGYTTERDQRLRQHTGTDPGDLDYDDPLHHAAIYPETVALTAILASPHWRKIALARASRDREPFHAEFTRRVTPCNPQPALLLRLVHERLTDPGRKHRISDLEDRPPNRTPQPGQTTPAPASTVPAAPDRLSRSEASGRAGTPPSTRPDETDEPSRLTRTTAPQVSFMPCFTSDEK